MPLLACFDATVSADESVLWRQAFAGSRIASGGQNGAGPWPVSDIKICVARRRRVPVTVTSPICSYGSST